MRQMEQEKWLAVVPHIVALLPLPLVGILLVQLYRVMFGDSHFVNHHARENINFQISIQIYTLTLFLIIIAVSNIEKFLPPEMALTILLSFGFGLIVFSFLVVIGIFYWGVMIVAIISALRKKYFNFPLTIRFLK